MRKSLNLSDDSKNTRKTIIRVVHNYENPFVQLNKKTLWDERLSLKAVGLWARCMSKPNDWVFSIKNLVDSCKEGRKAVDSAMKELIDAGYVHRMEYSTRNDNGHFSCYCVEYILFEFPATEEEKKEQEEIFKKSFPDSPYGNSRYGNSRNGHLLIKNSTETDVYEDIKQTPNPLTASEKQETKKETETDVSGNESGCSSKSKIKKTFSPVVHQIAEKMLEVIAKYHPVYRPGKERTQFLRDVEELLEVEKQDSELVLRCFEWAVQDTITRGDFPGWQGIICTNKVGKRVTNPAEQFKKHFSKIYSTMNSQKKRTFCPSSDQAVALAAMDYMNETAI